MIIKALSIRQPWAYAILHLGKDIENRSRGTSYRGRFLIHAAKTIDRVAIDALRMEGFRLPDEFEIGGIVGEARLDDVVRASSSQWFTGPVGYSISSAEPLEFKPVRGMLGFFNVEY